MMRKLMKKALIYIVKFLISFLFHPIKTTRKVYTVLGNLFADYRKYVPSYAPAALTFYVIVLIVPAVSIIAFAASLLRFDLSLLTNLLKTYLNKEYATMMLSIIENPTISLSTIVVLVFSVYAVSRGVGNIYIISKDLFPVDKIHQEGLGNYYFYIFTTTIFMLLATISFLFVLAIGPIGRAFNVFYAFFIFRYALLFLMVVLFFSLLYFFIPRAPIKFSEAFIGAMVTTVGMIGLYFIISIYFAHTSFSNVYGPLASIVMVFFVLNWGCEVFYIGLYVSHLLYTKRKEAYISRVSVERMNHHGQAIVHILKKVCYLYNVLPGEKIEVVVEKEGRRSVKGYVSDIIKASPARCDPICVQADMCHDCQLMYMKYDAQLKQKRREIIGSLKKYTHFHFDLSIVQDIRPAEVINNYKQYVSYPLYEYEGEIFIGQKNKAAMTFMTHCMLQDVRIMEVLIRIRKILNDRHAHVYNKKSRRGLRRIIVKKIDDKIAVMMITGKDGLAADIIEDISTIEEVNGLYYSIQTNPLSEHPSKKRVKVYGDDYYYYTLNDHRYRLQPYSYVFRSREMEEQTIELFKSKIDPKDSVLSLFTKTALLELELPNKVVGIGETKSDIDDAKYNAAALGLENKRFRCGLVDRNVGLIMGKEHFDAAIVHLDLRPMTSSLSQAFYDSPIVNLFIISNDPHIFASSLFASDTDRLQTTYDLIQVYALDQEPYTYHVETIFHLRRKEGK